MTPSAHQPRLALARPAVRFLKSSAALLLRGFDIPMTERAQVHSPEELKLIATADAALYRAKELGRNQVAA